MELLVKAFRDVLDTVPNAKLVVIGYDPTGDNKVLTMHIDDSVSFLVNVSTFKKIYLLKRCSAVALPGTFEGFGLVLLEAFAIAKPLLVSDIKPFDKKVDLPKDDPIT